MSEEDALLTAIVANVDDDTPRLVYADWLDENGQPERAEFIRVQIELAHLPKDDPRYDSLRAREWKLLQANEQDWLGPPEPQACELVFRRGFVAEVGRNRLQVGDEFATLVRFPTCEVLDLNITGDEDLSHLTAFPNLRRLEIWGNPGDITDASLPSIGQCSKLEKLVLHSEEITDTGLQHLTGLTALRVLDLSSCPRITDDGLQHITPLQHLEVLDLSDMVITGRGLGSVRLLPRLRRLNLEGTRIGEFGLANLVGAPVLEELVLSDDDLDEAVGDAFLAPLARQPTLRTLSLSGWRRWCIPGIAGFRTLQQLTRLEKLKIQGPAQGDEGLTALCSLPRLKRLSYDSQSLTAAGLRVLARIPGLVALQLRNAGITDEALECFHTFQHLRWLDLSGNPITNDGLHHLVAMPALESLILDGTQITTLGLPLLRPLSLRNFSTSGNDITYPWAWKQQAEWAPRLEGLSCSWELSPGSYESASNGGSWKDWRCADE